MPSNDIDSVLATGGFAVGVVVQQSVPEDYDHANLCGAVDPSALEIHVGSDTTYA